MELKDFIKTTVQSIIDATEELIVENGESRAAINPFQKVIPDHNVVQYYDGTVAVSVISFDVAVTEGSAKSGGGSGGINVAFAKIGADGTVAASTENISRVQFSMRVALPATEAPSIDMRFEDAMSLIPRSAR